MAGGDAVTRLSFCLPYYKNPGMLAEQYRTWAGYQEVLKEQIEIVLVDDGSPEGKAAVGVERPDGLPALRIYRVLVDIPWHQHGARNLAAKEADGPWLFLTDMDHVLPTESLRRLLSRLRGDVVYTFRRLDAPDLTPKMQHGQEHPHCNTFALTKARYWTVGGYDEDAVGYGTDGYFRQRLFGTSPAIHLQDVPIVRYPREVIPDASTSAPGIDPRAFRNAGRRTAESKRALALKRQRGEGPKVLAFPWERVL